MRPTVIERDNKRLLAALVLTCGLYGGLAGLALAVRFPDARANRNPYGTIRISLLPAVKQEPVRTKEAERTPEGEEPRREAVPAAAGPLREALPSGQDVAVDAPPVETSFSGEQSGGQSFRSVETAVSYPAAEGDVDQVAATKARFLVWLDAEIREKLAYPDKARRRNIEGVVTVRLSVPADGSSCDAVVTGGSGSTLLDRAAVDLVRSLFPADISPGGSFTEHIEIGYRLLGDR